MSKDISDNYECRIEEKNGIIHYFAKMINEYDDDIEVEVSEEVYNELTQNHREDSAQGRQARRHLERTEMTEKKIHEKRLFKAMNVDELIVKKIDDVELHKAIDRLVESQRKRVYLYFFEGLKLREIAEIQNCTPQAIYKSLKKAKNHLRKFLQDQYI